MNEWARAAVVAAAAPGLLSFRRCRRPSGGSSLRTAAASSVCTTRVTSPRPPLHPNALARFVDPLPIPRVIAPVSVDRDPADPTKTLARYRIAMREGQARVHRDLPPTRFWGYEGEVPGPTIEAKRGEAIAVEWVHALPERHFLPVDHSLHGGHPGEPEVRAVVHLHGGRVPAESDGHPEAWLGPGQSAVYRYPNGQDATLLWYHDHAMGLERLNVYAGLFGAYVIRDEAEAALGLPSGRYELPLFLSDRLFDADGQLVYPTSDDPDRPWVSEVYGDAHLVNGKLFPFVDVEPRLYRLRVVNAANARFYDLALSSGQPFHRIGTDQGLLAAPVATPRVSLAPAERADLLVDFRGAAGERVVLMNQAEELMQFRVAARAAEIGPTLPKSLRPVPRLAPSSAVTTRTLTLNQYHDPATHRMVMLLNGTYWQQPVTEAPRLDSVEIWAFVNLTEDAHPIHLHMVRFQVLDRQLFDADEYLTSGRLVRLGAPVPPPAEEAGWKDTVRADPGAITRIIAKFEGFPGRFVWHCHVLEHAANQMMRPFDVVRG